MLKCLLKAGQRFVTARSELRKVLFLALSATFFVTVALWNRADHYIFALWFLLLFSFFPRLISAVADWMSAILPHMVWPMCQFQTQV